LPLALAVPFLRPQPALGASEVHISDLGGQPDGSDTTPALAAALAASGSNSTPRRIHFGTGTYSFLTPPPVIANGMSLIGEGHSHTILERNYCGNFLTVRQQGSRVQDLTLFAGAGTSGGCGLRMVSDDTDAGGNHVLDSVWITGPGTWTLPLYLDGSARTIAPLGIRDCQLSNVMVFRSTWWLMQWWNAVGCVWYGGGAFPGGVTSGYGIAVGGPQSTLNLIDAIIDPAISVIWSGALRAPIR
jgi:hypothetical protein